MEWIKTNKGDTVKEIVLNNTGMTEAMLLNDQTNYHYDNLDEAVDLFVSHIKKGSKIVFFCDYDTDGVTSASEAVIATRAFKINATVITPRRFSDGYGVKERHTEQFIGEYDLLVLCDNGIAANEAIDVARAGGMDVIVLDHHEGRIIDGKITLPNANVIVDPHITKGDFDDLCGAGISYLFWEKVAARCNFLKEEYKNKILAQLKGLAAVGTIGDVVGLIYHNRKIVKEGLAIINNGNASVGVNVLLEVIGKTSVTATDIAFSLSPVINASGRLDDDGPAFMVEILSANQDTVKLRQMCQKAVDRNDDRKKYQLEAVERAKAMDGLDKNFIVIVDGQTGAGIVGLVSGNLTEEYNRPSLVFTETADPNILKGSGRSVPGVDLKGILDQNQQFILGYGGHPAACGITISRDKLEELTAGCNALAPLPKEKVLEYDLVVDPADTFSIVSEINLYGPYGQGNPEPRICLKAVPVNETRLLSNGLHIKLISDQIELLWFNFENKYKEMGYPKKVDVIGELSINEFRGKKTAQMIVRHIRPSK